jgi:hypothetical protein
MAWTRTTPFTTLTGYNRPEHLRAFPETDPVFADIQRPLRSSAESANRTIDDHLPRERLHHFGFEKNRLSMLAWQTYRNAQNPSRLRTQPRRHRAATRTHRLNRPACTPTDRQATYRRVQTRPVRLADVKNRHKSPPIRLLTCPCNDDTEFPTELSTHPAHGPRPTPTCPRGIGWKLRTGWSEH